MSADSLARTVVVTVLALTLGACAATPPGNVVPITGVKTIAGSWVGTVMTQMNRQLFSKMTITETGTDKGTIEGFVAGDFFTATLSIKAGMGETEAADGRLGTMTLYLRDGKQVLSTYTTGGLRGEYNRAP